MKKHKLLLLVPVVTLLLSGCRTNRPSSSSVISSTSSGQTSSSEASTSSVSSITSATSSSSHTSSSSSKTSSTSSSSSSSQTYIDPTSISIQSTLSLNVGETKTLSVTYTPSNCNRNKGVTWTSSDTSVATVNSSSGLISAVGSGSTTITATSTYNSSFTSTCTLSVTQVDNKWTIMLYICGSNLESENSLATSDLQEICSVSNQPSNVNIIIQTGGATSWSSKYGISGSYNQRYHVANKTLVSDNSKVYSSYQSMGLASTFKDFLKWGLDSYPAEKTGVILWNHGGAMQGVCYDEKKSDDSLTNSEMKSALSSVFNETGRASKLEFIGFDACLMQVQDVADFASPYFNYMIASEESESGYGWDYDTWVDDLYSNKDTTTILKAIVDGFINDNGGQSSSSSDQTLSYLNLNKMDTYRTAWESMATALYNKADSSFSSFMETVKVFCDDMYSSYLIYGLFDAKDFLNKLSKSSKYNPGATYITDCLNAFNDLVEYSVAQKGAGNAYGLAGFYSYSSYYSEMSTYYRKTTDTNFVNWWKICDEYGGSGGW